jgi:hypothetical protein
MLYRYQIVCLKNKENEWTAVRHATIDWADAIEIEVPQFELGYDLAGWCRRKFPYAKVGVVAGDLGPRTAARCKVNGTNIIWLK